jgi:hypothetical protein
VYHVGCIFAAVGPRMWEVKRMRRYRDNVNKFHYPTEDDDVVYLQEEIVHILSPPKLCMFLKMI